MNGLAVDKGKEFPAPLLCLLTLTEGNGSSLIFIAFALPGFQGFQPPGKNLSKKQING
jgi:hypothetical protein